MMNSRERVLKTILHETPDRIPVDFGSMRSTGITALAHVKVKKNLGIDGKVKVYDLIQQLAQPEDEILDIFGADVVDLGRAFLNDPSDWHDWVLPDGTECLVPYYFNPELNSNGDWLAKDEEGDTIARMANGAFYFNQTIHPLGNSSPAEYSSLLPKAMGKVLWAGVPSPPVTLSALQI